MLQEPSDLHIAANSFFCIIKYLGQAVSDYPMTWVQFFFKLDPNYLCAADDILKFIGFRQMMNIILLTLYTTATLVTDRVPKTSRVKCHVEHGFLKKNCQIFPIFDDFFKVEPRQRICGTLKKTSNLSKKWRKSLFNLPFLTHFSDWFRIP